MPPAWCSDIGQGRRRTTPQRTRLPLSSRVKTALHPVLPSSAHGAVGVPQVPGRIPPTVTTRVPMPQRRSRLLPLADHVLVGHNTMVARGRAGLAGGWGLRLTCSGSRTVTSFPRSPRVSSVSYDMAGLHALTRLDDRLRSHRSPPLIVHRGTESKF